MAKILWMTTNIKFEPVFYNDIPFRKFLMKSMYPFKTYWMKTNILTQQQKKN